MPWVRSGECNRCGQCCGTGNPYDATNSADDPFWSPAIRQPPVVAGYCPLFRWAKEGEGFCCGHIGAVPPGQEDSYYMAGCINWPNDPEQIKDKPLCSYKFEWVD